MGEKIGETREIARFVQRTRYEELPNPVIEKTKELILDQIGGQLASSTLPWNKIVYDYAKDVGSTGQSTIINYGLKVSAEFAALVNATFGHGFENDDYHLEALNHPGCVSVPPALAMGEKQRISGKALITAVAIGCEVMVRVGLAGRSMLPDRGIHCVSAQGPFASAAAAGKILNLDEERMLNALSLAGSHSSGPTEFSRGGGDVKRLYGGLAAMGGVRASLLARLGFTGPPAILEGKRGVLQAFCNAYELSHLTDGLGEVYQMLDTCIKPYCSCALTHSQIDVVSKIVAENNLKPEDIVKIEIGANRTTLAHVGSIGPEPKDIAGSQFSTHFSLGLAVVKGANDFSAYMEALRSNFKDPEVLNIAHRVDVVVDEECQKGLPKKNIAKAAITTVDGKVFNDKVMDAKGTSGNPMSREELEGKFMNLSTELLSEKSSRELKNMILGLEDVDDVNRLSELIVV